MSDVALFYQDSCDTEARGTASLGKRIRAENGLATGPDLNSVRPSTNTHLSSPLRQLPTTMSRISLLSPRTTFPPILRLPATQTGNNVPKSLHKTRRTWKANVHRLDQTVTLLDTYHKKAGSGGTIGLLQGVKMRIKDLRSYRKAGGVEGCVVSFILLFAFCYAQERKSKLTCLSIARPDNSYQDLQRISLISGNNYVRMCSSG